MKEAIKVYGLGILLMIAIGVLWEYVQPKPKLPEFAPDFTWWIWRAKAIALKPIEVVEWS